MSILGLNIEELTSVALESGLPKFTGKQLADWLYKKRATDFSQMTNIPAKGRERLAQNYTLHPLYEQKTPLAEAVSTDGTKKNLFPTESGEFVEAVYLPETDRTTLCVSTQAGCQMGCKFCMTGQLKFKGNLTAADILSQVLHYPDLTNIVLMGEGEPMNNIDEVLRALNVLTSDWGLGWSPKRITVSTVGIIPGLKRFLDESECHLAISLHNPIGDERARIMPAERAYKIKDVIDLIRQYDWSHQRRVSFEYICWHGVNDDIRHANELLNLLKGLECRVNLIRFHEGADASFPASNEKQMEWFRDYLSEKGLTTTIRKSRGEDILAACGMLANALENK